MNDTSVLDFIHTKQGKTYYGVIDSATTKHYSIYDFTNNEDADVIMMVIVWRAYYQNLRFSVYRSLYYPHIKIAQPVMINKRTVDSLKYTEPMISPDDSSTIGVLD